MPEKSVREMNVHERRHYSLAAKSFHSSLIGCILVGIVSLIIGLGLYSFDVSRQFISNANNLSRLAGMSVEQTADIRSYAHEVMDIYRELSEEERLETGSEAYRERFSEIRNSKVYDDLLCLLTEYKNSEDVFDVYIGMYDLNTGSIVYMVDPDEGNRMYPGDWEPVSEKGMLKFLNWDGTGIAYDIDNTDIYGWLCTTGIPIRDDNGDICAFVLTDVSIDNLFDGIKAFALQITIAVIVITALIAVLISRRIIRNLVKPINSIAQAAEEYVKDKRRGELDTEHFARLNIHTGDEVENLSLVMADMEADLKDYVENLTTVTAEKERVSTELNMATQIQEGMLPNIYPAFPDRPEFDVYATMDPAREVGGDFYDFFLIDEDHLCLVMADVSGKGIPAALFMMASKIILANNAMMGKTPAEILTDTNEAICSNNRMEMFVTVWLGILEISTGKLTAANAGHEYPVLKNSGGEFTLVKDKHGFVVGGMEGVNYREYEMQLEPGAKLFVYTDGVLEAENNNKAMFGTERMIAVLNEDADAEPEQVLKKVRKAVDDFVQDAEQFDDITMLCLEYRGK